MASFGFGTDLALKRRPTGAFAPAVAAITALQVLPANGLAGVDGADAADTNGWVAKATLPDDGASAFDPGKIVLTVIDPGFDANAAATIVTRTIRGMAVLRKQLPNQSQRLNSASSGVRTVYFALSDEIYQGSTIAAVQAETGYYGAAAAGLVPSITNGSTLAYPKPLFAWINTQAERATGASYAVEGVAFHRHAMNGRQVACVQYDVLNALTGTTVVDSAKASVPQLSAIQTQGQIAEVYAAAVPMAGLTNGNHCRINARVYPWLGDGSAVLDLIADGVLPTTFPWTMNPQTPLRFTCDRTGAYGGACAIVKPSGTATGTTGVATSYAGLGTGLASAYPTIVAALTALQSYNNANKGHNDPNGSIVYLGEDTAGAGAAHAIGNTSAIGVGQCWTDIKTDPGATGDVRAVLSTANLACTYFLRWQCKFEVNGGNFNGGSGSAGDQLMAWENGTINAVAAGSAPINFGISTAYFKNVTITGGTNFVSPFFGLGGTNRMMTRCIGVIYTDRPAILANAFPIQPYTLIGCRFANGAFDDGNWSANWASCDGAVVYNNQFLKLQAPCAFATGGMAGGYSRGIALAQNVIERTNTANSPALQIGADGTTQAFSNVVEFHNTLPGAGVAGANISRSNRAYADVAGAAGVIKRLTSRFNIFYDLNCKTDTFTTNTSVTGRTGNWRYRYHVSGRGNVSVLGDDQGLGADQSGGSWLGEVWGAGGKASGAAIGFTNNAAGTGGAGGGDYRLTGAFNDAYGRVVAATGSSVSIGGAPVPLAALTFDMAGVARKTDGNGAAGAYERTDI